MDLIRLILINEIDIDESRVNIYNEKYDIPEDDGLFILLESKGVPKTISNRNVPIYSESGITEKQELCVQEVVAVNVFSKNRDAEQKKEEVLMAINSIYSQQLQEEQSFKIFRNTTIENLSSLEASVMLNRFEISLMCVAWHEKTKTSTYFEVFNAEVLTEDGITTEVDI